LIGGGGGGTFITKDISRITSRSTKQALNSDDKVYLRVFYTSGTANESDRYTLTWSNATTAVTTIDSGEITSGDPADKSTIWPTKQIEVDGETVTVPKD
jgi:hypothetical protein